MSTFFYSLFPWGSSLFLCMYPLVPFLRVHTTMTRFFKYVITNLFISIFSCISSFVILSFLTPQHLRQSSRIYCCCYFPLVLIYDSIFCSIYHNTANHFVVYRCFGILSEVLNNSVQLFHVRSCLPKPNFYFQSHFTALFS